MTGTMETKTPTSEIRDAFRTLTQRLGGIFHEHEVEEEAIWAISRAVDTAFKESVQSVLPDPAAVSHAGKAHPAVVNLLRSIDKDL